MSIQSPDPRDPREHAFTLLAKNTDLSARHLSTLIGVNKDTARQYKNEYLQQTGQTEVSYRRASRTDLEQKAAKRITYAIGCSHMDDPTIQQRLSSSLNHLYADWYNAAVYQKMEDMAEDLEKRGVTLDIAHYTGDNAYPTEYTISYGEIRATGPTYDMALTGFIYRLLEGKA